MKKKILIISILSVLFALVLAFSASAENKIIKLDTCPTLEEIHANPDAYISHLDAFDGDSLGAIDSNSVVVLSDLAETPTYYVYPAYYYMRSTSNVVWGNLTKLNEAITAYNSTVTDDNQKAFASYAGIGSGWSAGGCKYLIRYEVPTYVTSISGTSKFEGDTNLLEVYFPVHTVIDEETGEEKTVAYVTSVSGSNLFSSCSKLEYIHNSEYLPIGIVQGNNEGFSGCKSLKEFKIPYGVTTIPRNNGGCFSDCSSLKEIILPNTVTTITKGAFSGCTSLEVFSFGAGFTTFKRVNVDYETFAGVNSLKFVYLPSAFKDSITATANDYKSIFSSSSAKTVYFYVGSEEDATTIRDKFKTTNANENLGNADIVAFDPTVDYVEYQKALTKSVIVYGYNLCDAFYEGEHTNVDTKCETADVCGRTCGYEVEAHAPISIVISYEKYTEAGKRVVTCDHEGCLGNGEFTLEPIFVTKGYSIKENNGYGIISTYVINDVALKEYEDLNGPITFGIIMANANFDGQSAFMSKNDQNKYVLNSSYGVQLEITNRNYAKINATIDKFTQDEASLNLVMALYVIDENGNLSYVQHEGTYAGEITKDATLDIVTITKIAEINNIQITLPEPALVPAGNDEE